MTYYYYNTRTTNEKSPVILYNLADTIRDIELQIRENKKRHPLLFKNNDIIKVFTRESEDTHLILFGVYAFKRSRLSKFDNDVTPILVKGENDWI